MLTRMTEEDWATVLELFRACRSRRGAKGRNDRIFLEALHYFAVHNITWRALPEAFGNWNSVWKRFWRLSQAGVFEAFFDALAATSRTAHLVQMLDSTIVRAHVSAAGAKGGRMVKRWAAPAAGSRPRSTSRLIWMGAPSRFTSQRVRPATARTSRSCSTSDPTSRPAQQWVIRAMMPRPIAQPRASAASAR
jgi:transposase